jgi:hypothetical protein
MPLKNDFNFNTKLEPLPPILEYERECEKQGEDSLGFFATVPLCQSLKAEGSARIHGRRKTVVYKSGNESRDTRPVPFETV